MKKVFLLILLVLSVFTSTCFAKQPVITSDTRTFNPMTGIYELTGNVHVELENHGQPILIEGQHAKVHLYTLEVHADNNISLAFGNMSFLCDRVDVYNSDSTAYVSGNCNFSDSRIKANSDKGSYCWKTKIAVFSGNVKLNGAPVVGDVKYNVETGQIDK